MTAKKVANSQYERIGAQYASLIGSDPSKQFVQYPTALRLLGTINRKNILDIGCGEGMFDRMLSKKGASIVGIDISKKQISHAVAMEKEHPLGIRYEVGSPHSWKTNALFDKVVTVLSIQYAKDFDGLLEFFALAHRQLKPGGEFVSVTFNPKFKRYGKVLYNRRFTKQPNRKMRVDFFGEKEFSATFSDLTIQDYVRAAKLAGFNKLKWEKVSIAKTGLLKLGSFWKGFLGDCPYIAFVARK